MKMLKHHMLDLKLDTHATVESFALLIFKAGIENRLANAARVLHVLKLVMVVKRLDTIELENL